MQSEGCGIANSSLWTPAIVFLAHASFTAIGVSSGYLLPLLLRDFFRITSFEWLITSAHLGVILDLSTIWSRYISNGTIPDVASKTLTFVALYAPVVDLRQLFCSEKRIAAGPRPLALYLWVSAIL